MFQCGCKVHLDEEITISSQMETATVATVGVEAEEGVAFTKVIARQFVPFVLCLFPGGGKQVDVASNVAAGLKVWLKRFRLNFKSVDVDGQEVNGVVLGVKRVFRVFAVVGVVVDAPQYVSFRQRPEEQVLVRVRHSTL